MTFRRSNIGQHGYRISIWERNRVDVVVFDSSFCFPIILNPEFNFDRETIFKAISNADIGYRIITGGSILRHDVMKYYDFEIVGKIVNANTLHDHGFFVGNHPNDLTPQITKLYEVLDYACN